MAAVIGDPYHKVNELAHEMIERAGVTYAGLNEEFRALLGGLLNQFTVIKKHNPHFDLRAVKFERPRWNLDGTFVMDISYKGSKLEPKNLRWD